MFFKEETRITMSSDHDVELEETLKTETTFSMEEEKIRKARVKMEEVKEENERLKLTLSQILKDYNSLKNQFKTQVEEAADQESKKAANLASMSASASASDEESDLVSLSLGRFSNDSTREKKKINTSTYRESKTLENGGMIELGLSCKPDPDNSLEASRSFDEPKEEEVRSSSSNKNSRSGDDEILQQTKKPRVSVRAVCNTQAMQDGCQWRKYGQKIAKGNPCPRAYYRCTVSSSCPVRKQVQRCMDDMSILINTYEGSHNHPLPPSAAAMASATSAAAAMLSCGSSATSLPSSSSPNNLFGYSGNLNSQNYPRATISSSQSHPTVVLDLTPPNHGTKFASSLFPAPHSSQKSFNFDRSSPLQIGWDHRFPSMNSADAALFSGVRAAQAANDRKIAAATTAITHDPNFRSALAAAITSFVGSNNGSSNNVGGRNSGMDFLLNFSQPKSIDEGGQIKL